MVGERNPLNNFLATDDVPPTLFGFEVVTENYTEQDLEFFRQHPDAGGFYDMGSHAQQRINEGLSPFANDGMSEEDLAKVHGRKEPK